MVEQHHRGGGLVAVAGHGLHVAQFLAAHRGVGEQGREQAAVGGLAFLLYRLAGKVAGRHAPHHELAGFLGHQHLHGLGGLRLRARLHRAGQHGQQGQGFAAAGNGLGRARHQVGHEGVHAALGDAAHVHVLFQQGGIMGVYGGLHLAQGGFRGFLASGKGGGGQQQGRGQCKAERNQTAEIFEHVDFLFRG